MISLRLSLFKIFPEFRFTQLNLKLGHFEQAIELANQANFDSDREFARLSTVAELARNGQPEQALLLTETLEIKRFKLDALTSIAIALINAKQIEPELAILNMVLGINYQPES